MAVCPISVIHERWGYGTRYTSETLAIAFCSSYSLFWAQPPLPRLIEPPSRYPFFEFTWACSFSESQRRKVQRSRKFGSTCDFNRPGLVCTCVDLRSLFEMKFSLKSTQRFLPYAFGHSTRINASWEPSVRCYSNLLANEIQDMSALFFLRFECTCEETFESVWLPNVSLYASSTCCCLRLLASAFGHGLRHD